MKSASQHNDYANTVRLDKRDWDSVRDRLIYLEGEMRRVRAEMALFECGAKERLDAFGVLLSEFKTTLAGKDVE